MPKPNPSKPETPSAWRSFNDYLVSLSSPASDIPVDSSSPARYFHRDLSWLHFNDRVLSEAADDTVPALERLRFAIIVSSNLDEFFMVRVADIARLTKQRAKFRFPDGLTVRRVMAAIRDHVLRQKAHQAAILRDILSTLAKEGIVIYTEFKEDKDLDEEIRRNIPKINFLVRRSAEALPMLPSDRVHVFVRFPNEYAIISIEKRDARLLRLPASGKTLRFALVERWLTARAADFFPGKEVIEAFPFKIIRDADLRYHPDDEDSLEDQIVEAVEGRTKARAVRLEVDASSYSEGALLLAAGIGLASEGIYRFDLPLDLRTLGKIYNAPAQNHLKYPLIEPQNPPRYTPGKNIFANIAQNDILLHHPYDSFGIIEKFLKTAAKDRKVTHIFHTLYRTSQESSIMEALKSAARRGKKVTVYVEIKARFDELNNVRWAEELRQAGVKVVRPLGGFKVHCKATQVLRREKSAVISYLHLATGNYHPGTARQYTDLGLLTADPQLGAEVSDYFSMLLTRKKEMKPQELLVAPINLHKSFIQLIKEETEIQKRRGRGHIIAKMNSLVDIDIINALYEASNAGVKVELLVRGICCLKPGMKGLSENIRVMSVVDRFLEHSRIYYFRASGSKKIYLSSADWMPRNFYSRFEIAFPIKEPVLKKYLLDLILATSLSDNVKGWELTSDGSYNRITAPAGGRAIRSQFFFEELAKRKYAGTQLASGETSV